MLHTVTVAACFSEERDTSFPWILPVQDSKVLYTTDTNKNGNNDN